MGWTSFYSNDSFSDIFEREFGAWGYDVIAYNIVREPHSGTHGDDEYAVAYGALRHPKGHVFALIVLLSRKNKEVFYKDMDETQGPHYYNMSREVFSKLTDDPHNSEYSKEWRRKVSEKLNINQLQINHE